MTESDISLHAAKEEHVYSKISFFFLAKYDYKLDISKYLHITPPLSHLISF